MMNFIQAIGLTIELPLVLLYDLVLFFFSSSFFV